MNHQAWHHFLESRFLGNSMESVVYCLLTIAIGMAVVWIVEKLVLRWVERLTRYTETTLDDFLVATSKRHILPALYGIVIYLGLHDLSLKPAVTTGLRVVVTVLVVVQGVRMAIAIVRELLERQMAHHAGVETAGDAEKRSVRGIVAVIQIVIWVLAFVLVLDNLGIRVSTFVAGLGITGIAVALAAQAILGDLFSYFVIFFDRPFQIGHSIKVGNFHGEVEHIGIKTTRLRSITGEQVVISNKYLTDNQVQNFKVMLRRRALLLFELEYKTSEAQLRNVPEILQEIISSFPDATFERSHFKEFGESGLRFESIFFVETPDMTRYMDVVQEVNLKLKAKLESMGVMFAHPARALYVRQGPLNGV